MPPIKPKFNASALEEIYCKTRVRAIMEGIDTISCINPDCRKKYKRISENEYEPICKCFGKKRVIFSIGTTK